jgi:hypothetical protein
LPSSFRPALAPSAGLGRRSRRRALYGFAALAAILHLAVLRVAGGAGGGAVSVAAPPAPVSVRTIAPELPMAQLPAPLIAPEPPADAAMIAVPRTAALAEPPVISAKVSARPRATSVAIPPTPTEPSPALESAVLAAAETEAQEILPEAAMINVALAEPRAAMPSFLGAGEAPPPTYRTVLPGPATLRYELRRGIIRGTGEIRWRPAGGRYALQFDARLAGISLLSQSSQGEVGANGLAPVRFVDQRASKSARAVNFSRETGSISFSGSTARWPLLAGSQDRLSWMIQLGGIVAADPALATSGRISMVLVSARGEASVRSARFVGREKAETVAGGVPALKFVIDGHSAYDGSFEIWLDPARGYLPVHATSRSSSGDAEFELLLQRADP